MMSYFIENEVENLQNGDLHLAQIPDFEMEYLMQDLFSTLRSVMACFFIFTPFYLTLTFFDQSFPLRSFTFLS